MATRTRSRILLACAALAAAFPAEPASAQQPYTLRGTVRDAAGGQPLAGAQVVLRGTEIGALSDNAGAYTLVASVPAGSYTVEATFIGRRTATAQLELGAQRVVTVPPLFLAEEAVDLEGLVVTGTAGPTARRALGTAVTTVDARRLANSTVTTLDQAIQGKVPGAVVTQNTGTPGGGVSVRLRGTSSIIAGAEPLYIVDGVILDNSSDQQINFGYRTNPSNRLADLDPNDVERVEILRGAAAAALYGSRANNGVVQIFTKRGSVGEPRISAHARMTYGELTKRIPFALTPLDVDGNPVTRYDHQDLIFRDAWSNESYASVSGGAGDTRYYVSGTLTDQQGIMRGSDYRRYNVRLNLDQSLGQRIQLQAGANFVDSRTSLVINGEQGAGGLLTAIVFTPTDVNLAERNPETGELVNPAFVFPNPLEVLESWSSPQDIGRFVGSFGARTSPLDNLTVEYRLGYDRYTMETNLFIPRGSSQAPTGSSSAVLRESRLLNNDFLGNLQYGAGPDLAFTTSAGLNYTTSWEQTVRAGASDLTPLTELVRGAVQSSSQARTETRTLGLFAQQQVGWRDRLFLTGGVRWDASSTFGPDERWQVYPKVGASYVLSDEAYWQGSALGDWFQSFRLRGALGYAGNQPAIGQAYARIPRYTQVTNIDRLGLVHLSNAGNPNLKPERQREIEAGVELSTLSDRVGVSFTYYDQYTDDLLLDRPFAPSSGIGFILDNVGEMSNKGVELELSTVNLDRPDFRWSSTLIFSRNRNKVEKLIGDPFTSGYNNRVVEGEPLGVFYDRYFRRDASGQILFDEDGIPLREESDPIRKVIGNPWPDWTGSLGNEFRVGGGWSASFLLDGQFGHEVWNQTRRIMDIFSAGPLYDRQLRGEVTNAYRVAWTGVPEAYLEDASYVKLREVALRYSTAAQWVRDMGLRSVELELLGRNLHTWTDYTGYDPEVNMFGTSTVARGVDFAVYPHARTFSLGVRATY